MSTNSIYVFMAGDNNLDVSGVQDIQEMLESEIAPELNVILQFDRRKAMPWEDPASSTTKRLKVEAHQLIQQQDIGETNTGDPSVLNEFLKWGTRGFPAKRKIAIIWNHGGGIKDTDIYKSVAGKVKSSLFVPQEQRHTTSVQKHPTTVSAKQLGHLDELLNLPQRMVCTDDTSRDFLDNLELKSALEIPEQNFDIIAFDACLMNMFEIIYQVKDIADIVIGSEDNEPANGWPYKPILNYLSKNQRVDNEELARNIVAFYGDYYAAGNEHVTQSAVRTDSLEKVASGLDEFAGILTRSMGIIRPLLADILISVQRFREEDYLDIYDLALLCQKNITQPDIAESASRLLKLLDESIIANVTVGDRVKNSHGMSIYFPLNGGSADEVLHMYRKLDFAVAYPNWLKLITAFHVSPTLKR
jgi:Clostripain family